MKRTRNILALVGFIVVSQLAGAVGGVFTASSVKTWYVELNKPSFTPPSWLFGPVWTSLYVLMGIAAWLVWHNGVDRSKVRQALSLFAVQLVLNAAWSGLFFGLRLPSLAFVELLILWAAILATMTAFFRVSLIAGVLMIPYQLWATFAAVLNFFIWRLNA